MQSNSFLYNLLKPFVTWACKLFYRNLHIRNSSQVCDVEDPIILISNHQNALIDPLLCCITSPKPLNFLTRADVFKNPTAKKILFSLNMMPVYRPHDKVNIIESNGPTFKESLKRLENNQIISLFPEGTHQRDQNLKSFKKGAGRLICDVFDSGKKSKIIIQPVGLHYTNISHSGYPCFVHYGEQLEIKASEVDLSPENRSKAVLELTRKMNHHLEKYVVHITPGEGYEKRLFIFRALQWRHLFSKETSSMLEFKKLEDHLDSHLNKLQDFSVQEILEIEDESFRMPATVLAADSKLRKKFSNKLMALLPIYALGFLVTALPYFLGKRISLQKVRDPHFMSTAKIVFGFVFIPVFWLLCLICLSIVISFKWALVVMFLSCAAGCIFIKYHTSYRILRKANSIRNNPKAQSQIEVIKEILS